MLKCSPLLALALVASGDNLPDPTLPHSGSRLKLAWYEYDGGARELETGWYFDHALGERCSPTPWSDGHRYCAPAAQTSCSTYYRTGRELVLQPMQPMFEKSGTTCALTARPSGYRFFELGERVYVPELGRVRESGTQRIRPIARVSGTLEVPDPLMYDAELDTECLHDGELQCVPRTLGRAVPAAASAHFADPQCEVPVGLAFVPRGACDPPQRFASDGADYYELREPYTKPIYVPSTGDTCSGFAPPAPDVAYLIGARMDRSAFARAQLVIEP